MKIYWPDSHLAFIVKELNTKFYQYTECLLLSAAVPIRSPSSFLTLTMMEYIRVFGLLNIYIVKSIEPIALIID